MSLLHKRSSLGARKVSPPQPTYMSDEQKASYLSTLRSNRPARPCGSRPLPSKQSLSRIEPDPNFVPRSDSSLSSRRNEEVVENGDTNRSSTIQPSVHQKGRPIAQAPIRPDVGSAELTSPTSVVYRESATRQLERQEAHSLRQALEEIDLEDEETKIHSAAQMEASDLVWKHRNPQLAEHEKTSAYRNPDLVKKKYVLRSEGSALDKQKETVTRQSLPGDSRSEDKVEPLRISKRLPRNEGPVLDSIEKSHSSSRRKSSGTRQVSSGSSKGIFRNPDDQIYEEPEELGANIKDELNEEIPLRSRTRNSLPRGSRPIPDKPHSVPLLDKGRINRFEIYKNPPSQSRNAGYAMNQTPPRSQTPEQEIETPKGRAMEIRSDEIRAATSMKRKDRSPKLPTPTAVSDKPGRPIVSFDPAWNPGSGSPRGSIDMDKNRPAPIPMPSIPTMTVSAPIVPTINLPDEPKVDLPQQREMPQLSFPDETSVTLDAAICDESSVPTICLPADETDKEAPNIPTINLPDDPIPARPLPKINVQSQPQPKGRPLPSHTQSSPPKLPPAGASRGSASRVPWLSRSPTHSTISGIRSPAVTCAACDLPISGRIVTASGSVTSNTKARFHPECFNCFHCSTALECVSFYPEPESALLERLGIDPNADQDKSNQDGQMQPSASDLRFYCHLDYHDLFSPKCASCHTPIEGAVVLAAGKAWHEGHFFCAECGDPFSSTSPFVESKGYAYCVSCHTRRTAARCRGCKKQILDEISVEALGGKWHEECFVCFECERGFGDEGRFFVREIEIELTEKEKRKGADYKKIEERAVCESCEGRRLKSWNVNAFL